MCLAFLFRVSLGLHFDYSFSRAEKPIGNHEWQRSSDDNISIPDIAFLLKRNLRHQPYDNGSPGFNL